MVCEWYSSKLNNKYIYTNPSWDEAYQVDSIIKDNNGFYFLKSFEIPQLELKIAFSIDEARNKVTAELTGTAKS